MVYLARMRWTETGRRVLQRRRSRPAGLADLGSRPPSTRPARTCVNAVTGPLPVWSRPRLALALLSRRAAAERGHRAPEHVRGLHLRVPAPETANSMRSPSSIPASFYPSVAAALRDLEHEAQAAGIPICPWGQRPPGASATRDAPAGCAPSAQSQTRVTCSPSGAKPDRSPRRNTEP